mgnify:FL=1
MSENQTTETVLLENCIKQYQILVTALKGYLTSMYKDDLHYDEIKRNLFISIKMINAVEEVMKVYNTESK